MSVSHGVAVAAPSPALLRYLRHQVVASIDAIDVCSSINPNPRRIRSCRRPTRFGACRTISTTTTCRAKATTYIDDVFTRNREKCSVASLPAPRRTFPKPPVFTASRHASSDTSPSSSPSYKRPSFFQRIFHRHKNANQSSQRPVPDYSFPAHSYEETSAQLFNLSRALSRNPAGTELKLRCTEFDKNGSVTLVSGEFKKSELIAKYGLLPRDLRKIDSSVLPHILVRPTAILINLLHLRVLIQSDRVLVFDAYGSTDSYTQSLFMYDLEGKLRQKSFSSDAATNLPYEFRALEAVLISVTSGLEAEFALVREPVTHILRALEEDIDREKLRHLLIHSKKLGTFEQKARLVRDALYELLEADDDLASMYLTERKITGKPREEENHTEVEMLLESYHKICDEVVEISGNLISNIRNTEEVVKAILDANRNQLMLFEIKVSIATLGLAGGTLIAGFYGMNLENFIEETNWGFGAVTVTCIAFSVWTCVYGLRKLRKVQKVRMWNEGPTFGDVYGRSDRKAVVRGWRSETLEALAMGEEKKRKMSARAGVGSTQNAGAGPVLWPGMEGLGLHKLNPDLDSIEDTNSDADDTSIGSRGRGVTRVRDDTAVGLREKKR